MMMKCKHPQVRIKTEPISIEEVDTVFLQAQVECAICRTRFAFIGVQRDDTGSPLGPTTTADGRIVNLPMMEVDERLAS